jgi:hypothetical protein
LWFNVGRKLAGYHLLPVRQGGWDQWCLNFFPICFDWRAERLPAKASHREVWVQDALSVTANELEDAETNEAFIKFVQGGESASWEGVRAGAGLPAKASHRELWEQDALSMTEDELEDAETNEDFIKFVQGGESTSWGEGFRAEAGAIGIKFQSGIWRLVNRLSRKIFGISLRRGFPLVLLLATFDRSPSARRVNDRLRVQIWGFAIAFTLAHCPLISSCPATRTSLSGTNSLLPRTG